MVKVLWIQVSRIGNSLRDEIVYEDSESKARHNDTANETLPIREVKPSCKDGSHILQSSSAFLLVMKMGLAQYLSII
jgi:hypothetical protein